MELHGILAQHKAWIYFLCPSLSVVVVTVECLNLSIVGYSCRTGSSCTAAHHALSTKASLIPSLPLPSLTQQLHTPRKKSILIGLIPNLGGSASLPSRPPSGDSPPPTWSSAGSREQGARAATPRDAAKALRQRTAPASSDHASPLHPASAHGSWEHRPLLHATPPRRRRSSKSTGPEHSGRSDTQRHAARAIRKRSGLYWVRTPYLLLVYHERMNCLVFW